jgi:hypothetical protein
MRIIDGPSRCVVQRILRSKSIRGSLAQDIFCPEDKSFIFLGSINDEYAWLVLNEFLFKRESIYLCINHSLKEFRIYELEILRATPCSRE